MKITYKTVKPIRSRLLSLNKKTNNKLADQHIQPECASLLVGTDKYHIQVSHHVTVGKNALNEYDQYAIYSAILNHGASDRHVFCL